MQRSRNPTAAHFGCRWLFVIGSLLSTACSAACPTPLIGNSSAVIVLLDYSKSFAPYSAGDVAALSEANKSIIQMVRAGSLAQPVKILWAAFGDNGLQPFEPCGPARVFSQRLTAQTNEQGSAKAVSAERLTNVDKLESWLSVCVTAVTLIRFGGQVNYVV